MRAIPGAEPVEGVWPDDMVLEIEDSPHALLDLLWLREACGLEPTGADLPPLLTVPPTRRPAWCGGRCRPLPPTSLASA